MNTGHRRPPGASHRARKRFGQNFLHDRGIIQRIVAAFDPDPLLPVVEIGPGKGALTGLLLERSHNLHLIEIDTDLVRHLGDTFGPDDRLTIHTADALKFDFSCIGPPPLQLIGNLPYNISTPLLFHLLDFTAMTKVMLLMLQKEVVDRICAGHNQPEYSRLSVMVQSRCRAEKLFDVGAGAFQPAPAVSSAVVRLLPDSHRAEAIRDPVLFAQLVRKAFGQRRKTLRKALAGLVTENCLKDLAISGEKRAENIPVDDYIRLSNSLNR